MGDTWCDDVAGNLKLNETVFMVQVEPDQGRNRVEARRTPGYTNRSHDALLRGWLGSTDNVSRTALGAGVVKARSARADRVLVTPLPDDDGAVIELCEELGVTS